MIAARLEEDLGESKGKVFRHIASDIDLDSRPTMFRDNTHTVTSVALCAPFIYLGE
jgi:ribosomal RNA-processing protein 9